MVIQHLKQIGKVKKLSKWVPHELPTNQNNCLLNSHLLLFYATINHFLIGLWCVTKSGFYMTTSLDQAQWLDTEAPKHFPKPNLHQKKVMVSAWWSAVGLMHYRFLNSITSEKYAQQTAETCQKLPHLLLVLVNSNSPILLYDNAQSHTAQPMLQNLNKLGYNVLPQPPYSPDRWLTDYHFFKHPNNFLQGKHFHNQQEAENAFQEFITSHQSMDFYVTGIKFFLMAKMCWFLMLLILIIKIFFFRV